MKVYWRKVRVQGGEGFLLAELWCFSLAGLVSGQKENLPSSCWGNNIETFFLLEMKGTSLPV